MDNTTIDFDTRLDTKLLDELYEGDKDHALTVFKRFLDSIHIQLNELDNIRSTDLDLFRQKVHKIKPVFSFVGLSWLTEKAELIENQCNQRHNLNCIENSYQEFKKNIEEFIPVIEKEVEKLQI
ncbi:MAG: hypothetical protein M3139_02330 [Bacteroidota bacterium]|nr:hypothetical protein [Bacteroidota bacterium]